MCISSITLAELRLGVEKSQMKIRNEAALIKMLGLFKILPFDDKAAVQFRSVCADLQKQGTPTGPMDTLIASHAKSQ
ncbi:MAG: type II toxin-antitoxin system VapC family toxin [Sutterella sp.]